MTYREDHDAALARVAALEQELAEQRRRTAEAEARMREAERERDRFAREVSVLRGGEVTAGPVRGGPAPSSDVQMGGRGLRIAVGLVVLLVIAAGILHSLVR